MRYRVLPYRAGSRGATALANALPRGRCLRLQGSTFRPGPRDVIINWGNTTGYPGALNGDSGRLRGASNKLLFFQNMAANAPEAIPDFWVDREDIPDDAFPVVCRTILAGHSGEGIVIAETREGLVLAPLYVRYVKKSQEYRIHLGRRHGETVTICQQRKARRVDIPGDQINWQVRNHDNGFVYVRGDVAPPQGVLEVSRRAFEASGLDFGAVDVIYNERQGRAYALEINTAPGLEGQTITDYSNFFQGF